MVFFESGGHIERLKRYHFSVTPRGSELFRSLKKRNTKEPPFSQGALWKALHQRLSVPEPSCLRQRGLLLGGTRFCWKVFPWVP